MAEDPAASGACPWLEPWVLLVGACSETGDDRGASRYRFPGVRESVLHLGRHLDADSPTSLARWLFIAREEHSMRTRMTRRKTAPT